MAIKTKHGFTVIELMLFLAISGALMAGLLIGSGVAVAQQRYRDSVKSLQSIIQDEYSEVANVVNDRPDNLYCDANGAISDGAGVTPRGASSSCVILGRLIHSHKEDSALDAGFAIHSYPVIAASSSSAGVPNTDTEAISELALSVDLNRHAESRLEWDSKMRLSNLTSGADPQQFSMLIVRSPLSGNIRTYTLPGEHVTDPKLLVDDANLSNDLMVCIEPTLSSMSGGEIMAIKVTRDSSNQSGVETLSQEGGNGC